MPTVTTLPRLPRRYFGVELETSRGEVPSLLENRHPGFERKNDCSISGWEFTSPKLIGREGLRKLRTFMQAGEGMAVNRECGFHAHFDMRGSGLTSKQLYTVWGGYLATEDNWFRMVAPSRQSNEYCHRWDERNLTEVMQSAMFRDDFVVRGFDRYNWLNVSAFNSHGTFENRLHQGTWNFRKVRDWIALNLRFIKALSRINITADLGQSLFIEKAQAALVWAGTSTQRVAPTRLAA